MMPMSWSCAVKKRAISCRSDANLHTFNSSFAAKIRLFWVVKFASKFDFERGRHLRFKFDGEDFGVEFGP